MSARASSVICGSSLLLCVAAWLLAEVLLHRPGADAGAYLASQAMSALVITQIVLLVLIAAIAVRVGAFRERLSILLCPVLLPLPLMLLVTTASDVSLAKALLSLAVPVILACVLSYMTGMRPIRAMVRLMGDTGFATLQLIAVAVVMAIAPAMYQWWQI